MKTFAFINVKGGVGKTTSATTIAQILAEDYQKKVLLVDLDPQSNATSLFSGEQNHLDTLSVLNKVFAERNFEALRGYEKTVGDLLIDTTLDVTTVIKPTPIANLNIIPAFLDLAEVERRLKDDILVPQQFRLKEHLEKVANEYDYCILDCSPSISIVNINGLAMADYTFTPLRCDQWGVAGFGVAHNLIDNVSRFNPKIQVGGCFFVQWDTRTNLGKEIRELMQQFLGKKFIDIQIRRSVKVEEMSHFQQPLLSYAPNCNAAQDYRVLTKYMVNHF